MRPKAPIETLLKCTRLDPITSNPEETSLAQPPIYISFFFARIWVLLILGKLSVGIVEWQQDELSARHANSPRGGRPRPNRIHLQCLQPVIQAGRRVVCGAKHCGAGGGSARVVCFSIGFPFFFASSVSPGCVPSQLRSRREMSVHGTSGSGNSTTASPLDGENLGMERKPTQRSEGGRTSIRSRNEILTLVTTNSVSQHGLRFGFARSRTRG